MAAFSPDRITGLLKAWSHGDDAALAELTPLVYAELRSWARAYVRRERGDNTLQTTGLVNECYLRLVDTRVEWQDRTHFFVLAGRLMRRILVDLARSRRYAKRGGSALHVGSARIMINVWQLNQGRDLVCARRCADSLWQRSTQRKSRIVGTAFFWRVQQ